MQINIPEVLSIIDKQLKLSGDAFTEAGINESYQLCMRIFAGMLKRDFQQLNTGEIKIR